MTATPATGYLHSDYAASLAEFGTPLGLTRSGGFLLVRPVPGSERSDAMGCYPLFFCSDWDRLADDLDGRNDLLSVTVVTDPFAQARPETLSRCFPELVRPFKQHFFVDLKAPAPSRHHREESRRALGRVEVDVSFHPEAHATEWERLYGHLRARHSISGLRAFSNPSFRRQLAIPGCVVFRALSGSACVAMNVFYTVGDVAYYHLAASDEEGYRRSAAYALLEEAITTFARKGLRWVSLGSGVGEDSSNDGLARFKSGWASGTRTAYLCGRVNNREEYAKLSKRNAGGEGTYFPLYRRGEFA